MIYKTMQRKLEIEQYKLSWNQVLRKDGQSPLH